MRRAKIFVNEDYAGELIEDDDGQYIFQYVAGFLALAHAVPVSRTLPLRQEAYRARQLFAFFDGLIPEGWLLDLTTRNWKLKASDRMGLLLAACKDCIGNVSVQEIAENG